MTSRVVIADDDADIRALVRIAVGKAEAQVVAELGDGVSAWQAIDELRPDLAVLDAAMPGMTGLEICRRTRERSELAGIRLVLLTAAADQSSRERGLAAGADEYVTKPFSLGALARTIAGNGAQR